MTTPTATSLRVVVADKMAPGGLELLARTPGIEVVNCAGKPREELERALERAHALIVRSETRVTADLMNRAPQLKVIARAGIGVDTIDVHAATRRGIAVMNAPGANTVSAAEHAMGLLLSLVRHLPWAAESMRRGEWDRKKYEGTELRGKTLGIVGLGRIGGHVAGIARAFGMTVIGHDPYLSPERTAELQVKTMPLEQMLAAADVVTLHLALTDQTRHLINAERLAAMKPTAIIVNTARGELIDEAALAAAIRAKKIAGAALDVFTEEPLSADSPLRKLDRVILTPHLAASTAEAQDRVSHEISTTVRDALLDGDLSTAVNVSGVGAEALRRATPLLDLARRLGRLALALADLPVSAVELAYGGKDDSVARPALLAALEGLLTGIGEAGVSLVNAPLIAEEHGIRLTRRTGAAEPGFETSLEVVVEAAGGRKRVVGALVAGTQQGRVIKIDDYGVDLTPDGWVLVIRNRDVPGVIGRVGTLLGEAGVNVASWNQARRGSGGEALAAIAVDQSIANGVRMKLEQLPDLLEVRVVHFG